MSADMLIVINLELNFTINNATENSMKYRANTKTLKPSWNEVYMDFAWWKYAKLYFMWICDARVWLKMWYIVLCFHVKLLFIFMIKSPLRQQFSIMMDVITVKMNNIVLSCLMLLYILEYSWCIGVLWVYVPPINMPVYLGGW